MNSTLKPLLLVLAGILLFSSTAVAQCPSGWDISDDLTPEQYEQTLELIEIMEQDLARENARAARERERNDRAARERAREARERERAAEEEDDCGWFEGLMRDLLDPFIPLIGG